MVLESFVANLLNKYLGDYVENLDKSQLKIGIWGGNVQLKNLDLKASALDELYLPVRVVSGHLGTLVIKIPWSKPYQDPWQVVIDGLLLVAVPNVEIKYDAAREESAEIERKQKKLNKIEDFKTAEMEKAKQQQASGKDDTFVEKLAAHVIKNLQVTITNVHVRYEDAHTIPGEPLAIGVTLENLDFQTVDESGMPQVIKESVSKIFKKVVLSSLAMYLDCRTSSCLGDDKAAVKARMQEGIARKATNGASHNFIVRPISLSVDLALDTKPALSGYKMPKALMDLVLEEIGLVLTRRQYLAIVELLQSFERMVLGDKYRKYRVTLPPSPTLRDWWQYAYLCMLEEEVRRRRREWSWAHMRQHRQIMRQYKTAYRQMLESKKPSADVLRTVEQCEKELNVFSITIVRQQAELEVERKQKEEKSSAGGGFFAFFSRGKKQDAEKKEDEQEILSPEEREKLYAAIGYDESNADPNLPKNYVAYLMRFKLHNLSLTLVNDCVSGVESGQEVQVKQVLTVDTRDVALDFLQKPAAESMTLAVRMEAFNILGLPLDTEQSSSGSSKASARATLARPQSLALETIAASAAASGGAQVTPLLFIKYEEKPDDGTCERRIVVKALPLEIVYDAGTVNATVEIFKPPENVQLKSLSKAAVSRYRKFKHQSSIGLQHIVEHHKYTELSIDIPSSYVIVPENGIYREKESNIIVVDLGHLKMNSEKDPNATKRYRAKAMMRKARQRVTDDVDGTLAEDFAAEVRKRAYDSFAIDLQRMQILYARAGADWRSARRQQASSLHLLRPLSFAVLLQRCMIEDVSLPAIRIMGKLPQLSVSVSDKRITAVLCLMLSIPLPVLEPSSDVATDDESDAVSVWSETEETMLHAVGPSNGHHGKGTLQANNMTFADISFEVEEMEVNLSRQSAAASGSGDEPFLRLRLSSLGAHMSVRSFDLIVDTYLCGVYLQHLGFKALGAGAVLGLVNTPVDDDSTSRLLTVSYIKANRDNPEFATTYAMTEQRLTANFLALEILLHQEALLSIMQVALHVSDSISAAAAASTQTSSSSERKASASIQPVSASTTSAAVPSAPGVAQPVRPSKLPELVTFRLDANLHVFELTLCTKDLVVLNAKVKGLDVGVVAKQRQTDVNAQLRKIVVYDPTPQTAFPKIVEVHEGDELLKLQMTNYVGATAGSTAYADMSRVDMRLSVSVNSVRVTYLNRWLTNVINFASVFEAAKQKVLEAGARVGEIAAEAAANLYARSPRVAISAMVKAPVVIVPRGSAGGEALLLNFGTLAVENGFHVIDRRATAGPEGLVPVLDRMKIRIEGVEAARVCLKGVSREAKDKGDVAVNVVSSILEPLSLGLTVSRNLSFSWYTSKPEVDVEAALPRIALCLGQDDYASVMAIMLNNMQEPPDLAAPPPRPPADITVSRVAATSTAAPAGEPPVPAGSPATIARESKQTTTTTTETTRDGGAARPVTGRVRCSFKLDSVDVRLYSSPAAASLRDNRSNGTLSSLTPDAASRDDRHALAHFQLLDTGFDLCLQTDASLQACVVVNDCILDDARPASQGGITRMIQRVSPSREGRHGDADGGNADLSELGMINLTYTQTSDAGSMLDVALNKIVVLVCLEYLVTVSRFFIDGMPKVEAQRASTPELQSKQDEITTEKRNNLRNALVVKARIENPDVILVEEANSCETNALVLDTGGSFEMRILPDRYSLDVAVNLQMISARYSCKSHSYRKLAQILAPCTIAATGSAPGDEGLHLNLEVSDLTLNVAPATISTISRVATNLALGSAAADNGQSKGSCADMWLAKKIEECSLWYVKGAPDSSVDDVEHDGRAGDDDGSSGMPRSEQIILQETKVVVMLEGGVGYRTVPLLLAELRVQSEVKDWSRKLLVSTDLSMEVAYYNERSAVWEPFVEPVEVLGRHAIMRPWQLSVQIRKNEQSSPDDAVDGYDSTDEGSNASTDVISMQPPKMTIAISSEDVMQICLTKAGLDMLTKLGQSFTDAYRLVEPSARPGEVLAPYGVRNDTGVTVLVTLDRELKPTSDVGAGAPVLSTDGGADGKLSLRSGVLIAAEPRRRALPRSESVLRRFQAGEERCFLFEVPGYSGPDGCTALVQKAELRSFALPNAGGSAQRRPATSPTPELVVQTEVELGRVLVVLRSPLRVLNHLEKPVEVWCEASGAAAAAAASAAPSGGSAAIASGSGGQQLQRLATIGCGDSFNVPLTAAYSSDGGRLYFKPADRGFALPLAAVQWHDYLAGQGPPAPQSADSSGDAFQVMSSMMNTGSDSASSMLPATSQSASFDFVVRAQLQKIFKEGSSDKLASALTLVVGPCLVVDNQLPYSILVESREAERLHFPQRTLEPCGIMHIYTASLDGGKVRVTLYGYLSTDWVYEGPVVPVDRHSVKAEGFGSRLYRWTFTSTTSTAQSGGTSSARATGHGKSLAVSVLLSIESGTAKAVIFSPYWMVNRSAQQLTYRDASSKDDVYVHPPDQVGPYLFAYNRLGSSKSDKVKIKISALSDWSDGFSLDTVGSSGTVSCKTSETRGRSRAAGRQVGVKISLASNGITKIVEFAPYFVVINQSERTLRCVECVGGGCDGAEVVTSARQHTGFYPMESHKQMAMRVEILDGDAAAAASSSNGQQVVAQSLPFSITEQHSTLLRLYPTTAGGSPKEAASVGAVYAECSPSDAAVTIQFEDFAPGNEAVRLVNHTSDLSIDYGQLDSSGKGLVKSACLPPGYTILYTWDDPVQPRTLQWTCGKESSKNNLLADGIGEFFVTPEAKVFWVSFLDGMQRVLLFTEDIYAARQAQEAGELEQLDQEIIVSLHGIGLSLVNNAARQEIAYVGVTSSGIVWEEKKRKRWLAMGAQSCETLEKAYQTFERQRAVSAAAPAASTPSTSSSAGTGTTLASLGELIDCGNGRSVSLDQMLSFNNRDGSQRRSVRRLFQPGVWLAYKTSPHQLQLHAKINRLQLDSPVADAVYPVVWAPTPLPKSITGDNLPKPFVEGSVLVRKHEHSGVQQVKYLKVLVQEMQLKADQGFINSLIVFFGAEHRERDAMEQQFHDDVRRTMKSLSEEISSSSSHGGGGPGGRTFYDLLHISPLKVHLSFSILGSKSSSPNNSATMIQSDVVNLFLQSVGMVLTDIQDVVFRLGYFERTFTFYDQQRLLSAIQLHYTQQAVKQAYVLVLGLDVLGNPFALVQGLAEGAKDLFYEPAQGLIQGPEEFAEGLALGFRSLFGHTVGGAAGAVSRITGTLGKGLAVLTLDDEYQRKRREKMNRQPANMQEGFARGVKGLGMGFFDGVTGIVRKPVEGAKQEGVEGFFKGLGKGLIGVVARPTGGIVDFASSSLEGVRRAAAVTAEVQRLRAPRFLNSDGIVRPYNTREAHGNLILEEVRNRSHAKADNYVAHIFVTSDGSNVLLATDRRVLFVRRGELLGHWDLEWQYKWTDLREPPLIGDDPKAPPSITFYTKEEKKKTFNPFAFGSADKGKRVVIDDRVSAEFMVKEMKEAYRRRT